MSFLFFIAIGVFGLFVGSFLNAVIYRLRSGESIWRASDRSHCVHCGHTLATADLIPLVSFLLLRGRCRYCKKPISFQYPVVELATAALFAFIAWHSGMQLGSSLALYSILYTLYLAFALSSLLVIFVYDLKHYLIPDKVLFPLIGITFLAELFGILNLEFRIWNLELFWSLGFDYWDLLNPLNGIIVGLFAAFFFFSLFFISRGRWMGFGDVKLAFFMGLFLGYPNILVALFFAFIAGAIIGIALIILGRKKLKSQVPFGPFLIAGTFVAFFWGKMLVNWYLNLFLP